MVVILSRQHWFGRYADRASLSRWTRRAVVSTEVLRWYRVLTWLVLQEHLCVIRDLLSANGFV